jgi:preprotein translocase subunit SecG
MSTLLTVLHVIVCLFLILTILLQSGKGGGMGAAFGGGNAATVFGGSGASSFLKRLTAIAGTVFMITSMVLAFLASHNSADALEKFGDEQQSIADQKEKAREDALKNAKPGAGSGSGLQLQLGSGATPVPPTPTPTPAPTPEKPATPPAPAPAPSGSGSAK